ncbi:MAG: hypothetical protein AAF211_10340 [Myxococcota bacterium]
MHRILALAPFFVACVGETRIIEELDLEIELGDETVFELETEAGELEIVGEADRTSIAMDVTLLRLDQFALRGDQVGIDGLVASLEATDDRVVGKALFEIDRVHPFATDVIVRLPEGFDVVVDDNSGDILITGVGAAEVDDNSGDITVTGAQGLVISDDSGEIDVLDIVGDVDIRDDSGDIDVREVTGDVQLDDASGDIYVADVTGTVVIDDNSGDIRVERVGELDVRSDGSGEVIVD